MVYAVRAHGPERRLALGQFLELVHLPEEQALKLIVLDGEFAVARLEPSRPIPAWATRGAVWSVTRTPEELSVVCAAADVPGDARSEPGWRCLRVAGSLDFSLTGILASLTAPLAKAGVSVFAVSTYDTDYLLVRQASLDQAVGCLRAAGHEVVS